MLYVFGECTLDTQRYELCRAGRVSRLRHKVFQVLVYLLAHAGRWDGRPLITFEGRAGYTLMGSTHIEGRLTLPLPASFPMPPK